MRTVKSSTTQFVVMEDGERLKTTHLLSLSGTGWQGTLFIDTLKGLSGAWPTGETDSQGHQMFEIPAVDDVIARAADIVSKAVAEMDRRGWLVEMLPAEQLLDDSIGKVGFVRPRNGEAGTGCEALPGGGNAAAADR